MGASGGRLRCGTRAGRGTTAPRAAHVLEGAQLSYTCELALPSDIHGRLPAARA